MENREELREDQNLQNNEESRLEGYINQDSAQQGNNQNQLGLDSDEFEELGDTDDDSFASEELDDLQEGVDEDDNDNADLEEEPLLDDENDETDLDDDSVLDSGEDLDSPDQAHEQIKGSDADYYRENPER